MLKRALIILLPILIVVGLLIYFFSSLRTNAVPADFTAARERAAAISQDIVNFTSDTVKKIESTGQMGTNEGADRILAIINAARSSNEAAYEKAFDLSRTLQQMVESLNNVGYPRQQLGYEAVALELSLVSELISYTNSLNDFLNVLAKSALNGGGENQKAVSNALKIVNQKANLINILNKNFTDKMIAFDQAS